jgi:hypothetical protein
VSFQGGSPRAAVPVSPEQISPLLDQIYARIDKANVPERVVGNLVTNGSFDFWSRGNGPFAFTGNTGGYTADRWFLGGTGPNGSVTCTKRVLSFGDIPGSSSKNAPVLGVTGQTGASDGAYYQHSFEGVETFAGKRIVVTAPVQLLTGAGRLFIELSQDFGTGGSALVNIPGKFVQLSPVLGRFGAIIDVPSIAGKIIGTNDRLTLNIWYSAGSNLNARIQNLGLQTLTFMIGDISAEELKPGYGDAYPGYQRVPKLLDQIGCLRFYQTGVGSLVAYYSGGNFGGGIYVTRLFPMRSAPGVSATNIGGPYTGGISGGPNNGALTELQFSFTSGTTQGNYCAFNWTASSDY